MRPGALPRALEAPLSRISAPACGQRARDPGPVPQGPPVPHLPTSPTPLRGRVFCGSAVAREGLRTRAQLRSSAWRRLYPDVHASSGLEVTPTPSGPWRSRACCCPAR